MEKTHNLEVIGSSPIWSTLKIKGLCQKSDFGPAYHKLGSYQVSN